MLGAYIHVVVVVPSFLPHISGCLRAIVVRHASCLHHHSSVHQEYIRLPTAASLLVLYLTGDFPFPLFIRKSNSRNAFVVVVCGKIRQNVGRWCRPKQGPFPGLTCHTINFLPPAPLSSSFSKNASEAKAAAVALILNLLGDVSLVLFVVSIFWERQRLEVTQSRHQSHRKTDIINRTFISFSYQFRALRDWHDIGLPSSIFFLSRDLGHA